MYMEEQQKTANAVIVKVTICYDLLDHDIF